MTIFASAAAAPAFSAFSAAGVFPSPTAFFNPDSDGFRWTLTGLALSRLPTARLPAERCRNKTWRWVTGDWAPETCAAFSASAARASSSCLSSRCPRPGAWRAPRWACPLRWAIRVRSRLMDEGYLSVDAECPYLELSVLLDLPLRW